MGCISSLWHKFIHQFWEGLPTREWGVMSRWGLSPLILISQHIFTIFGFWWWCIRLSIYRWYQFALVDRDSFGEGRRLTITVAGSNWLLGREGVTGVSQASIPLAAVCFSPHFDAVLLAGASSHMIQLQIVAPPTGSAGAGPCGVLLGMVRRRSTHTVSWVQEMKKKTHSEFSMKIVFYREESICNMRLVNAQNSGLELLQVKHLLN